MLDIDMMLMMIRKADDTALNQMLDAITERYHILHPDWEVVFLSWPLYDSNAKKRLLEFALKYSIDTL